MKRVLALAQASVAFLSLLVFPARADVILTASGSGWCSYMHGYCNNVDLGVLDGTFTDNWFRNWFAFRVPGDVGEISGATVSIFNAQSMYVYDSSKDFILTAFQELSPDSGTSFFLGMGPELGRINQGVANDLFLTGDWPIMLEHWVDIPLNVDAVALLSAAEGDVFLIQGRNTATCNCGMFGATFGEPAATLLLRTPSSVPGPALAAGFPGLLLLGGWFLFRRRVGC